jgi:hypothetical protein
MWILRVAWLGAVVIFPFVAGCVVTGNVQRAARVPHPGVPLRSGQPLDGRVELAGGLSNVTDVRPPVVGDADQAVEVPATQLRNELRFRLGPRADVALIYEHGFGETTQRPDPSQAPVGPGAAIGYGVATSYSAETDTPGLAFGLSLEVMYWSLPYVEHRMPGSGSFGSPHVHHGREGVMTLGLGLTPSYRRGRTTWFGGGFARNHPTAKREEVDVDLSKDSISSGPLNVLLHAGIEVALHRSLSVLLLVHQNVVANPVRYGPGAGAALTWRFE